MSTNEEYLKVEKISDFLSYVVHQSIKLAICARIDISSLHLSCDFKNYNEDVKGKIESKKDALKLLGKIKRLASKLKSEIMVKNEGDAKDADN